MFFFASDFGEREALGRRHSIFLLRRRRLEPVEGKPPVSLVVPVAKQIIIHGI